MRTDFFDSGLRSILTHEYTHLLLQETANDESLPAWLNEGMARNSEYTLGLESVRPDATESNYIETPIQLRLLHLLALFRH